MTGFDDFRYHEGAVSCGEAWVQSEGCVPTEALLNQAQRLAQLRNLQWTPESSRSRGIIRSVNRESLRNASAAEGTKPREIKSRNECSFIVQTTFHFQSARKPRDQRIWSGNLQRCGVEPLETIVSGCIQGEESKLAW